MLINQENDKKVRDYHTNITKESDNKISKEQKKGFLNKTNKIIKKSKRENKDRLDSC